MSTEPKKRGLFGRLFGGGQTDQPTTEADATVSPHSTVTLDEVASFEVPQKAEPVAADPPSEPAPAVAKATWFQRLKSGLSQTSAKLTDGITSVFTKRKLDAATLDDLEDLLLQADLGLATSERISATLKATRYDKTITPDEVRQVLATEVERVLAPVAKPLVIDSDKRPHVILFVGVNGTGKTTTIGKLAAKYRRDGKSVVIAAGDTFRAAAVEQLKVWGERAGPT